MMNDSVLKIAHILHSFGTGGMEKGVATLVSNASGRVEHVILCLTRTGDSTRLLPDKTQIISLEKPEGNSLTFLWQLSRQLRKINPDVVHTRNWGGTDGIIAARLAGIRSVVHSEHGFGPENPKGDIKKRILIHRLISPWVKEYICLSSALKTWVRQNITRQKPVTQIFNGVDTERYQPGSNSDLGKELGIKPDAYVIGIVATLNTIKDHPTLIRAFRFLRQKVPESILLIIGDGPERQNLKMLSGPGIIFLGNRKDVPELMQVMDVFVLPSINEGISNTILEAMATGLPVVASRVGGNMELVDDNQSGFLFPSRDCERLKDILVEYAFDEKLRHRHGQCGRKKVMDSFSVERMVDCYETIWQRVANS